jgi:hypothetical protein
VDILGLEDGIDGVIPAMYQPNDALSTSDRLFGRDHCLATLFIVSRNVDDEQRDVGLFWCEWRCGRPDFYLVKSVAH